VPSLFIVFESPHLCSEETPAPAETPAQPLEAMDLMTALQLVLKKSLAHGGLARGLHEGAKVIEKHAAQLCVLAEDCNQPDYVKLVKALCADHGVGLLVVPSAKTLGEWAGVSSFLLAFLYESLMFLVYI
jgi:small subunit ribosomal protein S12e